MPRTHPERLRITTEDQRRKLEAQGYVLRDATYSQTSGRYPVSHFIIVGTGINTRLMVVYKHNDIASPQDIRDALEATKH